MKKNGIILLLGIVSIASLSGCSGNNTNEDLTEKFEPILTRMKKSFRAQGTIKAYNRYYSDSEYTVLNTEREDYVTDYSFLYTYTNTPDYIGLDRKAYKVYNGENKSLFDENLKNVEGRTEINYISYQNELDVDIATDSNGLNDQSYGGNVLSNPFNNIETSDFSGFGDGVYTLSKNKASTIVNYMFSVIDGTGMSNPVTRCIFSLDKDDNIDKMTISLDESRSTDTDYDNNYETLYVGTIYTVNFEFSKQGTALSTDEVTISHNGNAQLRTAFDKIANSENMAFERIFYPFEDGVELDTQHETLHCYYNGTRIYEQIYDYKDKDTLTGPTASDVILDKPEGYANAYPYTLSSGKWKLDSSLTALIGYTYDSYVPIFDDVSDKIFTYDETDGEYHAIYAVTPYWLSYNTFLPVFTVSSKYFFGYGDDVAVKLNSEGDIDYIRISYWYDAGSYINSGYYKIFYETSESNLIPFGLDKVTLG